VSCGTADGVAVHGDAPVEGPLLNQVADDWFVELVEERTALAQSHRMGEEQQFVEQVCSQKLGGDGCPADADVTVGSRRQLGQLIDRVVADDAGVVLGAGPRPRPRPRNQDLGCGGPDLAVFAPEVGASPIRETGAASWSSTPRTPPQPA